MPDELPLGRARPRPFAFSPPVDPARQAALVAKAWLLELVAAAPLEAAADVPAGTLARDAPGFCALVLEALGSEEALDELLAAETPDAVARLAGAVAPAATVGAVEALRRGVWRVLVEGPPGVPAALSSDLADRLAHVCAALAAAAVAPAGPAVQPVPAATPGRRSSDAPPAPGAASSADPEPEPHPGAGRLAAAPPAASRLYGARPPATEEPVPLWQDALERQLADGSRTGRAFALLLVEVDSLEHLTEAEPERILTDLDDVGRALRSAVRRSDLLAHEAGGRTWVISADAGRSGALALAERLAAAVEGAAAPHGVPLAASVGVAVYPLDGRDAAALVDAAETSMLSARALGVAVESDPEPIPPAPPGSGPRPVP